MALTLAAGCGGTAVPATDPPADAAPSDVAPYEAAACNCVPAPPWGWRWVAYQAERTSCPSGWETPRDLIELKSAPQPAICSCTCTPPSGSPCTDPIGVYFEIAQDMCSTNQTFQSFSVTSDCTTAQITVTAPDGVSPWGQYALSSQKCTTTSTNVVPPLDQALARECDAPPSLGTCSAGEVCMPADPVAPSWSQCIETFSTDGSATCPSGFPDRHVVVETLKDSRSCGSPCVCSTIADCETTVDVFSDTSCSNHEASLVATACYPATSGSPFSFGSFRAKTTLSGGVSCSVGWPPPAPQGGVYTTGERVICCQSGP